MVDKESLEFFYDPNNDIETINRELKDAVAAYLRSIDKELKVVEERTVAELKIISSKVHKRI